MSFFAICAFGLSIYALIKVNHLADEVRSLKAGKTPLQDEHTDVAPRPVSAVAPTTVSSAETASLTTPAEGGGFIEWMQKDWLMKLGALLLLVGFGWFLSYAFANNWIGPIGRIALGLLAGALIFAFGTLRIREYLDQGAVFTALGSGIFILTVFAARGVYDFFTPFSALVLMFAAAGATAIVSVLYRKESLATVSLLLAGVAPLLTDAPNPDVFGLFAYLLVVVFGTLWVVFTTGWRNLTFVALLIVGTYGAPFLLAGGADRQLAFLFSFVFAAVFFFANTASLLYQKNDTARGAHIATALGLGVYIISWILTAGALGLQSMLLVGWAVAFITGSFLVYRTLGQQAPFWVNGAVAAAFLATATALEWNGPALIIAYTLEIGLLSAVAFRLSTLGVVGRILILYIGPVMLSFESLASRAWDTGFLHDDFFALAILMATLLGSGIFVALRRERTDESSKQIALTLVVGGSLYLLALIWLVLHSVLFADIATMFALFIYTILGLGLYVHGHWHSVRVAQVGGGLLLGLVIARLFLVDVWQMELAGRIVTFFVVGALLISTAFMSRKGKVIQ